ncbi:hypothetical protein PLICRDRAFT_38223 [Plicaturopsis crispa FD-325 SS-3]|nr:hypothetical protein PLICRDRAFT_38223 [Plicaturopsis crispa FD-325 SS-3]
MDAVSNSDVESSVFALLPSELILKILDIAAASSRRTALALCMVSSWTRILVRRRLLETVIITTKCQAKALQFMLLDKEGDCAGNMAAVRYLWSLPLIDIVAQLPNLAHLAITPATLSHVLWKLTHVESLSLAPRNCDLHLTLISSSIVEYYLDRMTRYSFAGRDNERPAILGSVTHLSFAFYTHDTLIGLIFRASIRFARIFPRLTHMALCLPQELQRNDLESFCIRALAPEPLSLQALVLVMTASARSEYADEDLAYLGSLRKWFPSVYVVDDSSSDPKDAWLEEVHGVDSIWDRAVRQDAKTA